MRHGKKDKKLSRHTLGQRVSFLRNLAGQLIENEKMETTVHRAKVIKPQVEKLITLAKKQNLASLRLLISRLPHKAAFKLFYEIAKRYEKRSGGYIRIVKSSRARKRDAAPVALVELV